VHVGGAVEAPRAAAANAIGGDGIRGVLLDVFASGHTEEVQGCEVKSVDAIDGETSASFAGERGRRWGGGWLGREMTKKRLRLPLVHKLVNLGSGERRGRGRLEGAPEEKSNAGEHEHKLHCKTCWLLRHAQVRRSRNSQGVGAV
jgi:hypothetical protein